MIKDDRTISEDSWLFTDYITVLWSKNLIFFISRISQDCGWKARQRPEILLIELFYHLEAVFISKFYISVGLVTWNVEIIQILKTFFKKCLIEAMFQDYWIDVVNNSFVLQRQSETIFKLNLLIILFLVW